MSNIILRGEKNKTLIEIIKVKNKFLLHHYNDSKYIATYYFYDISEAQEHMITLLNSKNYRKYGIFTVIDGGKI